MTFKKIMIGVIIAMAPISGAGMFTMYSDVQKNTEHRVTHSSVMQEIQILRKDVCWIKSHLRGETVPSCDD